MKKTGSLRLESFYAGDVVRMGSGSEHVVISEQGYSSVDVRTRVWVLSGDGAPRLVLDEVGYLDSIETRPSGARVHLRVPDVDFGLKGT